MDRNVKWSPEAIARHIDRDSVFYARAVATRIIGTGRSIQRFPQIGRIVPERGDKHIRERFEQTP